MIRQVLAVAGLNGARLLRWNLVGLVAEAMLLGIGFALLVPLLDRLLSGEIGGVWAWLAAMASVLGVYAIVRYRTQMTGYRAAMDMAMTLFSRLGDHIARLPLGWFDAGRVGEIGQLTSQGVIDVISLPADLLRPLVIAFVTPVTVIALMFVFDWRLAMAALITAPVLWWVYRRTGDIVQRTDHRNHHAVAEASGRMVEFAQSQAVLRAFGRTAERHHQLDEALQAMRDAARDQILAATPGFIGFSLVIQLAFTIVMLFGTSLALGGEIDAPEMLALLVLTARYVEPLILATDIGGALRISENSLARMGTLLATPTLAEPERPTATAGADIVLDSVGFAYRDRAVLNDVSFIAPARSMTALVGASGSGKTTILRLIARFWDVDTGAVRIGGADIRTLRIEDLMAQISTVFQDVYLFDGTIEENLRMGRPDATDADLREAARMARVAEIVERLPDGYATRVGEGGTALSGGERQRVSIARAILKNAPIVLLDEATAALDPENEAAVQDALRALAADRTLLVIAHRLQTVRSADQILVLDQGRIVEQGTHDDLLALDGRYAAFWAERSRAAGWRLSTAKGA
ncbi:MAG: ABC transporter ATP-binding protein [Pseudomonadota bacterium]